MVKHIFFPIVIARFVENSVEVHFSLLLGPMSRDFHGLMGRHFCSIMSPRLVALEAFVVAVEHRCRLCGMVYLMR